MSWLNIRQPKKRALFRSAQSRREKKTFFRPRRKLRKDLYYQDKRIKRKKREWVTVVLHRLYFLASLTGLCLLFYLLFWADIFQVKKVIVLDNQEVTVGEIEEQFSIFSQKKKLGILPAQNIFLLSKNDLRQHLLANLPRLAEATIEKKLLDVLKITVREKKILLVWVSGNELHYVDEQGIICCRAALDEVVEKQLPLVYDAKGKPINLGEEVVTRNFVGFLQELHREFPARVNEPVKKFWVPSILTREVHLETNSGWKVYFSIDRTVESQLNDLKVVLDEQIKNRVPNVDYIDLRVENWIYYKYRDG